MIPAFQRAGWTLVFALGVCASAHAEVNFQVRFFTVRSPLAWLDSVSVSGHYRSPVGNGPSATLNLSAERALLTFGVQYSRPNHTLQASGRRSTDALAGHTDTLATVVYAFAPQVPAEGVAFTCATVLHTLSSSLAPTSGNSNHTAGAVCGVRLSHVFNVSTTPVELPVLGVLWSGTVSSALTYTQGGPSAYLVPGVSLQNGAARWTVVGGGSASLGQDLSATDTVFWSGGPLPGAGAPLTCSQRPWQLSGIATTGQNLAFGVGARSCPGSSRSARRSRWFRPPGRRSTPPTSARDWEA